MAYGKSVQRVLAGTLNLRGAPTEIPNNDFQKLANAAYDQDNVIRSRKGSELICSASGPVKQMIRALDARWEAVNDSWLVGFKDYVWKAGPGQAAKNCTNVITTPGMRKSKGTEDWRWAIKAPEGKPDASSADPAIQEIDDFQGDDWTVDPPGFDELHTEGLRIAPTADQSFPMVFSAEKSFTLDLATGKSLDDLIRVQMRAKAWSSINGVAIDVDVGDGTFKNDYYRARMLLKDLKAAKKETITVYFRKRIPEVDVGAEDKFKYANFERVGQSPNKDWRSVSAIRVKVEFNDVTKFWWVDLSLVGNADNQLEGDDFKVCYTYVNKDAHESNPSDFSDAVVVNRGSILVQKMLESDDPQVTGKNIYVTGGTLGAVYRANDDPVTGDTFTITDSANDLSSRDIELEIDHDDPPDAEGIAGPYYDRILAWKGRRFYWSHQEKPYAFAHPDIIDGDWAPIDEQAGNIKYISIRPHEAWIYAENEIYILVGDPGDANGEVHPSGISMGTPSRNGVAKAGGGVDVAYLGSGIYLVSGSSSQKLSQQIDPIFHGREVSLWDGTVVHPISDPSTVCVGYDDGIIRLSYDNTYTLRGDLSTGRWFGPDKVGYTAFQGEGESGIIAGQQDGSVLKLEQGFTDNSMPIHVDFLSKAYDCGIQDNEKRFEDITLYHDTAGQDLTVTIYELEGLAILSHTINSFGRGRTVIQLNNADGIRARNLAIRIEGDTQSEIFIYAIDIHFYPEARQAKSYDTAVANAGSPKVKLIRELAPELENDVDVTFRLESDVPSFALTNRETHVLGTNLFRRRDAIVMDSEVYGHNFRVAASAPTGHFRLFELWALVQVVGTYLHGQKGEYWLSDPVDFGTERVKMIKELEIVYSGFAGQITVESDLPGNAIILRGTAPFPQVSGEQSIKIRLPGTIKGRLFRFKITDTADVRIEAVRAFLKMIGEPNATPWHWLGLPLEPTQDGIWVPLSFPQDQIG